MASNKRKTRASATPPAEAAAPIPASAIELVEIDKLIPDPRNTKTHTREQAARLAGMVREFGFTDLVLIDGDNVIRAGHGRRDAVSLLREQGTSYYVHATKTHETDRLPCVRLSNLTPAQLRALVIQNNRAPEVAGSWDMEALRVELGELSLDGFDMALLGYTSDELDTLLSGSETVDIGGTSGDDSRTGVDSAYLKFGKESIPLTEDELEAINARYRDHVSEHGMHYGFVASLLGLS
jgi:hypothetical protein